MIDQGINNKVNLADFDQRWVAGILPPDHGYYAGKADRHDTVPVSVGLTAAWVDASIAPLIHYLWKGGVNTTDSCQDLYGGETVRGCDQWVIIGFATLADMDRFADLVLPPDDPYGDEVQQARAGWEWDAVPQYGEDGRMAGYVEFPAEDMNWMMICLMVRLGLSEAEVKGVVDLL